MLAYVTLIDPRDEMTLPELLAELEVSHPEELASFERRFGTAMAAIFEEEIAEPEDADDEELAEELSDLRDDLREFLRI